uniref:Uncharacterized protein n=1 Tax=Chenopodium quinoa TaxID=63459 RepID=A0A803MII9_CHEQI
ELLDLMQTGNLVPEVAFLNASLIPDAFPVLAAAYKALLSKGRETLTTRTLHSELVYNYSGSKHITESLKRCGISDSCTYILAACFDASANEIKAIQDIVKGNEINLEELAGRANQCQILKIAAVAALCVQYEADFRPNMTIVVKALQPLLNANKPAGTDAQA